MAIGATIGAAVIGAGASYLKGKSEEKAADKVADALDKASQQGVSSQTTAAEQAVQAQVSGNQEAIAFQKWAFEQTADRQEPWIQAGRESLSQIMGTDFMAGAEAVERADPTIDPGYDFRFDEGQRAQERGASARGNLLSGGQAKALQKWSQGLASQEYQNAWNRSEQQYLNDFNSQLSLGNTRYNQLAGIAGAGQTAAGQLGVSQSNLSNSVSAMLANTGQAQAQGYQNIGNAQAQGYAQQGQAQANQAQQTSNAWGGAYQGVAGAAQQGLQNYYTNQQYQQQQQFNQQYLASQNQGQYATQPYTGTPQQSPSNPNPWANNWNPNRYIK